MLTEDEVKLIIWKSIAIMKVENENVLVFIYPTPKESKTALSLIRKNGNFKLKVLIDKQNKFTLQMELNGEDGIVYETNRTKEDYPPLAWLQNGLVKKFTTGNKDDKKVIWCNSIHPLDSRLNLN